MRKIAIIAAAAAVLAATPAFAGEKTSDMTVQLQVLNNCTLSAPETLDFGSVTDIATASASATATVNCTLDADYTLSIGDGANYSGGTRHMLGNVTGDLVPYYITVDGGSDSVSGTGTGAGIGHALAGILTATAAVKADNYEDLVVVSLTY